MNAHLKKNIMAARRVLLKRLVPEIVWPQFVPTLNGHRFPVRGKNYSFGVKRILKMGAYEREETALIDAFITEGMIVFEMGASIGFVTSCIAAKVGETGKVIAVEASDTLASELKAWITAEYQNVTILSGIALPICQQGAIRVSHFVETGSTLGGHVAFSDTTDGDVATSDQEVFDLDRMTSIASADPDALVIDIEGAEEVLADLDHALPISVKLVIIELHPHLYAGGAAALATIVSAIEARGFRMMRSDADVYCFTRSEDVT